MRGGGGKYVNKQFWGELQLVSGASVHARIFGSFSSILLEDLLTELGPLTERDVIITNFGAWYPRFVKQVGRDPTDIYVYRVYKVCITEIAKGLAIMWTVLTLLL